MIDEKIIEQLLAAFYNGNTTPEEEEVLLNFFKNLKSNGQFQTANEKFLVDSELFQALYDSSRIPLPEGFSLRLEKKIDKHIALKKVSLKKIYLSLMSAAAVIMLCIALFFNTRKQDDSLLIADTYSNPEEAAVAVEQALMLVSTKLNKGLSPFEKSVNTTNRLLNENFTFN